MLRSALFTKYPGSPISKSYDQNKFSIVFINEKMTFLNRTSPFSHLEVCDKVQLFRPRHRCRTSHFMRGIQDGVFLQKLKMRFWTPS